MSASIQVRGTSIDIAAEAAVSSIKKQLEQRTYRTSNELRNAALLVLRGQRNGRTYRVPGTKRYYTASAPGEPPAVRTGAFRLSWQPKARISGNLYVSSIESNQKAGKYILGELLEGGTPKMAPRPHHDRIKVKAEPAIVRIYSESYF